MATDLALFATLEFTLQCSPRAQTWRWYRESCPAVGHDTKIAMADARMGQVDQNLARAGLRCIELDDLRRDSARFVIDGGLVLLWNLRG